MKRVSEWYDLESLQSFYMRVLNSLKASDNLCILGEYFDSEYVEDTVILNLKIEKECWQLSRKCFQTKCQQDRVKMVDDYFDNLLLELDGINK